MNKNIMRAMGFGTQVKATEAGLCPCCGGKPMEFRDNLSKRAYEISGLCQDCQDSVSERMIMNDFEKYGVQVGDVWKNDSFGLYRLIYMYGREWVVRYCDGKTTTDLDHGDLKGFISNDHLIKRDGVKVEPMPERRPDGCKEIPFTANKDGCTSPKCPHGQDCKVGSAACSCCTYSYFTPEGGPCGTVLCSYKSKEPEPEGEYEEWGRVKEPSCLLFSTPAGSDVSPETCVREIARFGGFVFRREGQDDHICVSPVMLDMGEDDYLTTEEYTKNVKGVVYADAVRMRRV